MKEKQTNNAEGTAPEPDDPHALTAKKEQALLALLSHPTIKEAALAAGISETTLWRYQKDEEFSQRLREARREAFNHTVTRLQNASSEAVTVLRDLMLNEEAPPAPRVTAARTVLDYSFRAVEIDELKARIDQLEEFIKVKQEEDEFDALLPNEDALEEALKAAVLNAQRQVDEFQH